MEVPPVSKIFSDYFAYRKLQRKIARVYYARLLKAALFISIVPIMILAILVVYGRLTLGEGIFASTLALYGSMFFAKPYLADLSALTNYVEELSLDLDAKTPPLSFLSNVEELSHSVSNLHHSWEKRKKQLESALAESRLLFDTIPDILLMVDSSLEIVRANHAAFFKLRNNLIRQQLENIFPNKELIERVQYTIDSRHSTKCEIMINRHNVEFDYNVRIESFPIDAPRGIAAVIILQDITEAKRSKQTMKDFVANASHEIRTPLTGIVGFIESIQDMDDSEVKTRNHFLSLMSEQADRMTNLVNDLLSLSKVEANQSVAPTEIVDIKEIVLAVIRRMEITATNNNIVIKNNIKNNLPKIIGDSKQLTQVFTNLVSNAIKYGNKDTEVIISTEIRKSKDDKQHHADEEVCITVKDQGDGIDKEHLPRITERFYRIDSKKHNSTPGTGLGLSIVKHILNRHKGYLEVISEANIGSEFTVVLPV